MTGQLRRYTINGRRRYTRPTDGKARTISVWITPDDEKYVEKIAKEQGVTKNRAFAIIIDEHRDPPA